MADPATQKWYSGRLSTEQERAVESAQQSSAILASAGSGKTRTLVHALVDELLTGTAPENVIAFTFTKKAAEELRTRVHLLLRELAPDKDYSSMSVGTIHAWCFDFLLREPEFYNFTPLDEDIQVYALVSRLYDSLGLEQAYAAPFPRAIMPFLTDLAIYYNECIPLDDVPEQIRPCIERFEDALKQNRLLTFGAMVRYATELLEKKGPLPDLKKLFVDEYQDVNPAQVRLIKAMLPRGSKIVVVGDDLQCIYNWRGSDVSRIIHFANEFGTEQASILSENYRSRPRVVDFCNAVASNIVNRFPKEMEAKQEARPAAGVYHNSFASEPEQAEAVALLVEKFHSKGVPYGSIAVLMRSVASAGPSILNALAARAIPIVCPLQRQCGTFIDEFLMPLLEWLQNDHAEPKNEQEETEAEQRVENLWKSVQPWLKGEARKPQVFWKRLSMWMGALNKNASTAYNVRGQLYDFLLFCGIQIALDEPQLAVALGIASQIIRAVEEIHRRRLAGSPRKKAKGMMRDVFYAVRDFKDILGESIPVEAPGDAVLVTTVHQSKGLEWPVVIVPTLNKARFPVNESTFKSSFDPAITVRYGTRTEDEWRLFYVASSRARERLFLFDFAGNSAKKQSPFIAALNAQIGTGSTGLDWQDEAVTTLSAEEIHGNVDVTMRLGFSDAVQYGECPFQYALRRLVGIQPAIDDTLGYGQSIHEIAQRRANHGKPWAPQDIDAAIENFVHLPYVGDQQLQESKAAIKERIRGLQAAGAFDTQSRPEVDIEVGFSKGVVAGVIDSVVTSGNQTGVSDWKTNIHAAFVSRYEEQLRFYAHALRARGQAVDFAQLIDIGTTFKSGQLHTVPVDIAPEKVQATITKIEAAVDGISNRQFAPTPSLQACSGCDMSRVCSYKVKDANAHESH